MPTAPHAAPNDALVRAAADSGPVVLPREDGRDRVRVIFGARGHARPGVWAPAFGRPLAMPMQAADEPGLWWLDADLPTGVELSWALVEDIRDANPGVLARLTALTGSRARAALGGRFAEHLTAPFEPTVPTPHRLIGGADLRMGGMASVLSTGGEAVRAPLFAARPVPDRSWRLPGGHRLDRIEPAHDGPRYPATWAFDGELVGRMLGEAGENRRWWLLANPSPAQRFADHGAPVATAREFALWAADEDIRPELVLGASAAAATAIRFAARCGARSLLLLSPAFLRGPREAEELAALAASSGIALSVHAGSEERMARRGRPGLLEQARSFVRRAGEHGGQAEFTEFVGGHDLVAWHRVLAAALEDAVPTAGAGAGGKSAGPSNDDGPMKGERP